MIPERNEIPLLPEAFVGYGTEGNDEVCGAATYIEVPTRIALRDPRCKRFVEPETGEVSYRCLVSKEDGWGPNYLFGGIRDKRGRFKFSLASATNAAVPGFRFCSSVVLLSLVDIGVYLYSCRRTNSLNNPDKALLYAFGNNRESILNGELYRFVTPIFFHCNLLHLAVSQSPFIPFTLALSSR